MKILLTGFDPFGGDNINPAWEAVRLVPTQIEGIQVIPLQVPTVYYRSIRTVIEKVVQEQPDAVLCVGQAGGRYAITPERVAINCSDSTAPDNEGKILTDTPIEPNGPPAYFSTLPIKAMVEAIQDIGLPASLSNSAGTFVCNHLMYGILHFLHRESPHILGGFVHVPFLPSQVIHRSAPSLSALDIAEGLSAAIRVIRQA